MKNSILSFVAMAIVIMVSSCHKTSSDPSILSGVVNNTPLTSSSADGALLIHGDSFLNYSRTVVHLVPIKHMSFGAQNFNLVIWDWRDSTLGDGIRIGTYYFNYSQCPYNSDTSCYTHAGVVYNGTIYDAYSTFFSSSALSAASTGSVIVTACDEVNHRLTGTFSGVLIASPGDTLKMTNGVFTNVSYTVYRR